MVAVTAELAKRATALAWRDFPEDLIERTKQCLLDWFAVTVAGAQEELTDILVREAIEDGAKGTASLVGRGETTLPSMAALINGAASHALDYDDGNFGTMCKPLHAGTASEHGLRAARLAAKGFTARGDSLECDQGFASSQSNHLNTDSALGEPPSGWHLRNNLFKYHAACYMTHAPIECAKEIRLKSNFPPERVKKIVLRLDAAADKVCNIANPMNGLEAKFSLRQTVAMALSGVNTASLESY